MFAARFANKMILIGDPKHLPSDVQYEFSDMEATDSYYKKLNEIPYINYLFENVNRECFLFLNKQYRMVKEIGSYISDTFYNEPIKLENGRQESYGNGLNYVDYDFRSCKVACPPLGNDAEIEIIKSLLNGKLQKANKKKIAIITPYKEQMRRLRTAFDGVIPKYNINTVDAFQGQENDIVIFSCVRNVGNPTVFFEKINRINVAISRAKNQIWVVGASSYLKNVPCLNAYINYASKKESNLRCNKYRYDKNNIVKVV
jgi:superfamily I DNA and/or RNA helicase